MQPTSQLCRTQEAHHLARAAGATLDNIRAVATQAAAAWGKEAADAERREQRQARARLIAAAASHDEIRPEENSDSDFASETTAQ